MTLIALIFAFALPATASTPTDSVQIGTPSPVRPISTGTWRSPLETEVKIDLADVPLQAFFEDLSRQTKLEFILVNGLADCTVGVHLSGIPAREALSMTLLPDKLTYQQLGRSNSYTIVPRNLKRLACPKKPNGVAGGKCAAGPDPITLQCIGVGFSSVLEQLHAQSGANLLAWGEVLSSTVSLDLSGATLEKALRQIRNADKIEIKQLGEKNEFTFVLRKSSERQDSSSVEYSTRVVTITPTATYEHSQPFRAQ